MGKKNSKAAGSYNGQLTFVQFKEAFKDAGLSDENYRRLYESLSDSEVKEVTDFIKDHGPTDRLFPGWENPLARGAHPTKLTPGARLSGNAEELKAYLNANEKKLNVYDTAYLLKHIEVAEKVRKLNTEAAEKLLAGENRPKKPEIYVDENGYTRLRTEQPAPQHTSQGCWSVGLQQLVQSRGVEDVTQEDIRAYRPEEHSIAGVNDSYNKKFMEEYKQADEEYNKDKGTTASEMLDSVIKLAPNTMVRVTEVAAFNPYEEAFKKIGMTSEQYHREAKELIRQTVEKAIFIDHSPLVIKEPGHFLNVMGIRGETLLIQDSRASLPGKRMREIPIDEFVTRMMERKMEGVSLIWAQDIQLDRDAKKIMGVPEGQAEMLEDGTVQIAEQQKGENEGLSQTQKSGLWVNRYSSRDVIEKTDEQHLTKEGLIRGDHVYLPKKLNANALRAEMERRSDEEQKRLEDAQKLYYADSSDLKGISIKTAAEKGFDEAVREAEERAERLKRQREELLKDEAVPEAKQAGEEVPANEGPVNEEPVKEVPVNEVPVQEKENEAEIAERERQWKIREVDVKLRETYSEMADLQTLKKYASEKLEELRPTGLDDSRNSPEFNNVVKVLQKAADLDLSASPREVSMLASQMVIVAKDYSKAYDRSQGLDDSYDETEEVERTQLYNHDDRSPAISAIEADFMIYNPAFQRSNVADRFSELDSTRPIKELMKEAHSEAAEVFDENRKEEIHREAAEYFEKTEAFFKKVREYQTELAGLKKTFGSDSETYKKLLEAVDKAAALSVNSSPYEVASAVENLGVMSRAYIDKIDKYGGAGLKNGQKRYEIAGLLDELTADSDLEKPKYSVLNPMASIYSQGSPVMRKEAEKAGFTFIAESANAFTKRYSKEKFIELAQDRGWTHILEDQDDRKWLSELYDAAMEDPSKEIEDIMERAITANVWNVADRMAESGTIVRTLKALDNGKYVRLAAAIPEDIDEQDLLNGAEFLRNQRIEEGRTDGTPKAYYRTDLPEPEPRSPYFTRLRDANGRKLGNSWEEFGLHKHFLDTMTMASDLADNHYYTEEMYRDMDMANGRVKNPLPEYAANNEGSLHAAVIKVFDSPQAVAYAKRYMRQVKDAWLRMAGDQPDTPDGRLFKRYYEDCALMADPDLGNMGIAISDKPYMVRFKDSSCGGPKVNRKGYTKEQVLEALHGKGPMMEDVPEELRQDILQSYMDYLHACSDEVRVEYHRQQMAVTGWDDEKEAIYAAELAKAHKEVLRTFKVLEDIRDIGQYDDNLNNTLDHLIGRNPDSTRDNYMTNGMMRGEMQALANGWRSEDLIVMNILGGMDSQLEKAHIGHERKIGVSREEFDKLDVYEEAFRKLKAEIWNKKNPGKQDVRDALEKLKEFSEVWKGEINIQLFRSYNENTLLIEKKLNELKALTKPLKKEADRSRDIAAAKESIHERYAEKARLRVLKEADDAREKEDIREQALQNGWTDDYIGYIEKLVDMKNSLSRQLEVAASKERLYNEKPDAEKTAIKREIGEALKESVKKLISEKVRTEAEMKALIAEDMEKLKVYLGRDHIMREYYDVSKRILNTEQDTLGAARLKENLEKLPPLNTNVVGAFCSNMEYLIKMMPDDVPEKKALKEYQKKIDDFMGNAVSEKLLDPKTSRIYPSLWPEFNEMREASERLIAQSMKNVDPEKQPLRYALSDELMLLSESFKSNTDFAELESRIVPDAGTAHLGISDVMTPGDELNDLSVEEQKKKIEEFEKAAVADKSFFDVMAMGRRNLRSAIEYKNEQQNAAADGRVFDEKGYRERLRKENAELKGLAVNLLQEVDTEGFKNRQHPELSSSAVPNMKLSRGLVSIQNGADMRLTMMDMGMDPLAAGSFSRLIGEAGGYAKALMDLKELSPASELMVSRFEVIGAMRDPERLKQILGDDPARGFIKLAESLRDGAAKLNGSDAKSNEKIYAQKATDLADALEENVKAMTLDSLKACGRNRDMIVGKLGALINADLPDPVKKGRDEYISQLAGPDRLKLEGSAVVRGEYSPAKRTEVINLIKDLYRSELEGALKAGREGDQLDEGITQMKNTLSVESSILGYLKGRKGFTEKTDLEALKTRLQTEIYDEKRNEIAKNLDPKAFATPEAKIAEADRLLHNGLSKLPGNGMENFRLFSRSEAEVAEYEQREDEKVKTKVDQVSTYRMERQNLKFEAQGILLRLNQLEVNEDTDGKLFTNMRKALEDFAKLDDGLSQESVDAKLDELKAAADAYFEDHDTVFRRFKSDKGNNRLDLSTEISEFCDHAKEVLNAFEVDKKKKTDEMVKEVTSAVEERNKEKNTERNRRNVGFSKLMEEERKESMAKAKKAIDREEMKKKSIKRRADENLRRPRLDEMEPVKKSGRV